MSAHQLEGCVHGLAGAFGEHARGPFEQDPAVQSRLELCAQEVARGHGPFLNQADGCDVGEGLSKAGVG